MASSPYMASGFLRYLGPPALAIWDWSDGSHVDLLALVTAPDTWQDPSSAQSFNRHSAPPIRALIRLFLSPACVAGHLSAHQSPSSRLSLRHLQVAVLYHSYPLYARWIPVGARPKRGPCCSVPPGETHCWHPLTAPLRFTRRHADLPAPVTVPDTWQELSRDSLLASSDGFQPLHGKRVSSVSWPTSSCHLGLE